jgi:hypothetical protein
MVVTFDQPIPKLAKLKSGLRCVAAIPGILNMERSRRHVTISNPT